MKAVEAVLISGPGLIALVRVCLFRRSRGRWPKPADWRA